MLSFKSFITEKAAGPNLHMIHIEDQVLYGGVKGTREAINALRSLRDMLSGSSTTSYNTTVKYDGAPAIFCGIVPKGYRGEGQFFVSKKGLFNKEPKYYLTPAEIDADASGDLATKLKECLKHLPGVFKNSKDIFQGDLMFTSDDIKKESIDGQSYYTFQPNTIMYAIPTDSPEGAEVKAAKMGIVFHTRYKGTDLTSMQTSFDVTTKDFKPSPNVWLQDAMLKNQAGTVTMTASETAEVTAALSVAGRIFRSIAGSTIRAIENDVAFARLIEQFNNTYVRANQPITNTAQHTQNFIQWISDKYQKEIDKRKTEKGKQAQIEARDKLLAFFTPQNTHNLKLMFDLQSALVIAKNLIIKKMNALNKTKTFLRTKNGYKATNQEGYVAISQLSNGAFKLVDRLEFSYANFSPDIIKGWQKT